MNTARFLAGERLILTLWVGGLWAIGFMVAPVLFAQLDDRALAGTLAGVMFELMAWVGLACGSLLLLFNQLRKSHERFNWRALVLFLMLSIVIAGQFFLSPMIADLRSQGLTESDAFGRLHGIASVLYLVNSLLGLGLVVAGDSD